MLDRINRIIEKKQMSTTQFADYINIQRPTMSHIISGRNNPSLDIVMKILTAFPDINSEWLMFGSGKMYKEDSLIQENNIKEFSEKLVFPDTKLASDVIDLFSSEESTDKFQEEEAENRVPNEAKSDYQEPIQEKHEERQDVLPNINEIRDEDAPLYIKTNTAILDRQDNSPNINVRRDSENQVEKGGKQIRKIVFFYADKTFSEYYPEN